MRRHSGLNTRCGAIRGAALTPIQWNLKSTLVAVAARVSWLLLLIVAVVNVLLIRQNDRLAELAGTRAGDVVAKNVTDLSGLDIGGHPTRVQFGDGRKYLVFGFATGCRFCDESVPNWIALSRDIDRSQWVVVWVSRDSLLQTQGYPAVRTLDDLVLADVPHRLYVQLGLAKVPRTVVLTAQGAVSGSHLGLLDATSVKAVLSLMLEPRTAMR